jgi:hypothetical protein
MSKGHDGTCINVVTPMTVLRGTRIKLGRQTNSPFLNSLDSNKWNTVNTFMLCVSVLEYSTSIVVCLLPKGLEMASKVFHVMTVTFKLKVR